MCKWRMSSDNKIHHGIWTSELKKNHTGLKMNQIKTNLCNSL